jgi:hypothetical protein
VAAHSSSFYLYFHKNRKTAIETPEERTKRFYLK